ARPALIRQIRDLIVDRNHAHLVPFSTTPREIELAVALGIPMYGADPKYFELGTKSGARRIFTEEGVLHPTGRENLHSEADVVEALLSMLGAKRSIRQTVIKLNEGVSGEGNATIELAGLASPPSRADLAARVRAMKFELADAA